MKIKNIFLVLVSLPMMFACSDFLDVKDESVINPAIWDNENSAKLYLNNLYGMVMPGFNGVSPVVDASLNTLSDDVVTESLSTLLSGNLVAGSVGTYSAATYQAIRYVNIAFEAMKTSTLDRETKNRINGQLYFFRAFQHWKLVNLYGGVPYMLDVVDYYSEDEILNAPRAKTSECIQFLKNDLDSAVALLPAAWPSDEYARITRAGAAALKGRILMFYASPQFNPDNLASRWQEALDANLEAKAICLADGYKLMDISTAKTEQWPVDKDLNKIFSTKKSAGNPEVILVTPYLQSQKYHSYEINVRPVEITNGTSRPSNLPSWDLVASFPMKDGSAAYTYEGTTSHKITFTGNSDLRKFYQNRDPRFYATIAFNGCYYPLEGNASRRQWTYTGGENALSTLTTNSGFYCRKMVNPNITGTDMGKTYTDWVILRYAEVLLNLAECAYEVEGENSQTALDNLIEIRSRAGIEAGVDNMYGLKSNPAFSLREIILNERRVEFAFEGHRFWDLRRRNMFTTDLGSQTTMINGFKKTGSGYTVTFNTANVDKMTLATFTSQRETMPVDSVYKYFTMTAKSTGPLVKAILYKAYTTPGELQPVSNGSYNFFDIPFSILTRSPALDQTWGWENGGFNPFE